MEDTNPTPISAPRDTSIDSAHQSIIIRKEVPLTRALRSHQLWLTITYFGLLALIGRGLAG